MAWISATTLDDRNANLNTSQIAAILARVPGKPQEGSVVILPPAAASPWKSARAPPSCCAPSTPKRARTNRSPKLQQGNPPAEFLLS